MLERPVPVLYFLTIKATKAVGQHEFPQYFPQESWVEHDANEIWETQLKAIREVIATNGVSTDAIAAMGNANQRKQLQLFGIELRGEPVHSAIVWQDRRTASICEALNAHAETFLNKTGLVLDAYFSGTKIKWILDSDPNIRRRAEAGG